MKKIIISVFMLSAFIFVNSGCSSDFMEKTPSNAVGMPELEDNLPAVKSLMNGTYKYMQKYNISTTSSHDDAGVMTYMIMSDIMGLDIMTPTNWYNGIYQHNQTQRMTTSAKTRLIWQWAYFIIKNCNSVIDLCKGHENDPDWIQQEGQARVMRAYCYHGLVRFYQKHYRVAYDKPGVPLVLTPAVGDPEKDSKGRGLLSDVYTQMETDLKWAITNMTDKRDSKGHINSTVAKGLLARIYLDMAYVDNTLWDEVIKYARDARAGNPLMQAETYAKGFNDIAEGEWIWGLKQDVEGNINYPGFYSFYDLASGRFGYQNVRADMAFVEMFSDQDSRKCFTKRPDADKPGQSVWDRYSVAKFTDKADKTGDLPYMRSAEMVLMEAEALANKGLLSDAQGMLDELRAKRITGYTTEVAASDENAMLERIWVERRKELYAEGFALWDILRLGFIVNGDKAKRSKYHDGYGLTAPILDNDYRYIRQIPQDEFYANVKLDPVTDQNQ